jgi:hypothetical protein
VRFFNHPLAEDSIGSIGSSEYTARQMQSAQGFHSLLSSWMVGVGSTGSASSDQLW